MYVYMLAIFIFNTYLWFLTAWMDPAWPGKEVLLKWKLVIEGINPEYMISEDPYWQAPLSESKKKDFVDSQKGCQCSNILFLFKKCPGIYFDLIWKLAPLLYFTPPTHRHSYLPGILIFLSNCVLPSVYSTK